MTLRTKYESVSDLENEYAVAHELAKAWGHAAVRVSDQYSTFDWRVGPHPVEIKCRTKRYDSYHIASQKWSRLMDIDGILVVKWPDEIVWTRADQMWPTFIGGRNNPRDKWDRERMVEIPARAFHPITEIP